MTTSDSKPGSVVRRNKPNVKEQKLAVRTIAPGAFKQMFIEDFSARTALKLLRQNNAEFPGFRTCALAALCTWIFAPNDDDLRRDAIAVAAAKYLKGIERPAVNAASKEDTLRPIINMIQDSDFYEEIYYPLGGISTVSTTKTPEGIYKRLKKHRVSLDRAITMMRIGHWVFDRKDPNLLPPSLERSSQAAQGLVKKVPRTLKSDWAKHRQNIALAYAASTIQTKNNKNLLDRMQSGSSRIISAHIDELCKRAIYVNKHILEPQYKSDIYAENHDNLPIVLQSKSFAAEPFSSPHDDEILEKYRRRRPVSTAKEQEAFSEG